MENRSKLWSLGGFEARASLAWFPCRRPSFDDDSRQIAQDICISPIVRQEIIPSDFDRAEHSMELDLRDLVEPALCLESNDLFVIFVHLCRIPIWPDRELQTRDSSEVRRLMIIMDSSSLHEDPSLMTWQTETMAASISIYPPILYDNLWNKSNISQWVSKS
jgi:hypothetical protein